MRVRQSGCCWGDGWEGVNECSKRAKRRSYTHESLTMLLRAIGWKGNCEKRRRRTVEPSGVVVTPDPR